MITIRKSEERGRGFFGWLDSRHSFSFANYYDPNHMGVSKLRVINDDIVAPGAGFGTHPHRDMEILSVVLEGSIEHQDSMGNIHRLNAGEVQLMSAGTGVTHSEYNPSQTDPLRFLQIWIMPEKSGLTPGYAQRPIPEVDGASLLVSPDGADDSLKINQDAKVFRLQLGPGEHRLPLPEDRIGYLHVISGGAEIGPHPLSKGDAATLSAEANRQLVATEPTVALLFDLPN